MPMFMTQFSYTPQAWAALSKNPEDRGEAVSALAAKMGGKMHSLHYCFGDYDGVIMLEAPDESTVLSILIAAIAPGHVRATKTTTLFTPQQAIAAMRKAGSASFKPPAG
jgi:uncharacterized protein with GYD domain